MTPEDDVQATQEQPPEPDPAGVGPAPTDKPIAFPDEAVNLLTYLLDQAGEEGAVREFVDKTLPNQVLGDYEEDKDARKGWMDKRKERLKLFLGDLEPKSEPFKHCANMHDPVLAERLLRITHRVYSELFPSNTPMFDVIPANDGEKERAELLALHENWQFTHEIQDFRQQVRRALQEFFRDGDCIIHSYFDMATGRNRHEHLSPEEFVYPYTHKVSRVDMSDVPRKTRIWRKYKREIQSLADSGYYDSGQVAKLLGDGAKGSNETGDDQPVKDQMNRYEGIDPAESQSDATFELLEQHTWVKFPGDDRDTPVRVVVEYKTRIPLGLYKREYDDPEDRGRFDRETQEFQAYVDQMGKFAQAQQLERQLLERIQQPDVPADESLAVATQVQRQSPPAPIAPPWMKADETGNPLPPRPCSQKVIEQFSHGVCIENPDGSHGLGLGILLMPHQQATNILLNQFVDAGTLANSNTFIMHELVQFDPGVKTISPNTINRIRGVPSDAIQSAIYKLPTNPPNPMLLEAVKQQEQAADGVASAPDVLSGEKDGAETYRGQASRVEQAVKQLTVFASNFVEMLTNVEQLNAQLNFQYLPDSKLMVVLDPRSQQMRQIKVGRDLYRENYAIHFCADLRFASKAQRIAEADDALGMLTKGVPPQLASSIFRGPQVFAAAVKKCLVAREQYDLVSYVKTDAEIEQAMQQQAMQPPPGAMPGGPPGPGPHPGGPLPNGHPPGPPPGPPPPAIPSGQSQSAPGARPPQRTVQQGVPVEAAPMR